MRVRVSVETRMKSRLDRWTGANTNGPWLGTCSRPWISSRKYGRASTANRPRMAPYAKRSSRVGGWTSTASTRRVGGVAGAARPAGLAGSVAASLIDPPGQVGDDLVDGHVAGVELDGVVRQAQRIGLAPLVVSVAPGHVGRHRLVVEIRHLGGPPLGPDLGAGGQVHLEHGVGEHHSADVPPLQDPAGPLVRPLPLPPHELGPHLG